MRATPVNVLRAAAGSEIKNPIKTTMTHPAGIGSDLMISEIFPDQELAGIFSFLLMLTTFNFLVGGGSWKSQI
jgi:hypothetical protein